MEKLFHINQKTWLLHMSNKEIQDSGKLKMDLFNKNVNQENWVTYKY